MKASSRKSLADYSKKSARFGPGCLRLFFLPFLVAGVTLIYVLTIRPALQGLAAREWTKTPCVVESSKVVRHSGKDSTTYRIEVAYRYSFADQSYTSTRYHFAIGATGGRKAKAAVVRRYPPGTETFCYVNPAAPQEAVLERGFTPEMAVGAFGLLFAIPGALGLIFAGRLVGARRSPPGAVPLPEAGPGGPTVLRPKYTPLTKFFGMLAFSVIFNAFIGVFVYLVFFAEDAHRIPWFVKAMVSLFALFAVASIFGVFTSFLALFNPRIRLTAPATAVPLGGELHFTWVVTGRTGMLRKLRIVFEGREEATYKRGTNTSTDTEVFAEIPVFESAEREFLSQGSARVAVPANLMHTFEAASNKVLWRLKVHGEIPRWPDVTDEYPITVLPLPPR